MEEEYINFGDELILKSDFLKAINDAKAYSATQPWSAARRGAFDAVSELAANRGILSTRKYTNPETGESMYYATFGGDPFDINTYDKNTRRGWLDYVNFVGRLAESLPTKKSIDEKKKKEEEERIAKLPTFDNTAFINLLTGNISKGPLGGQKWDVNLWNTLDDTRDEKGAVGIDNRKTELIKQLRDIDKNFKAEDYNWKDSPFKDADDFKARLAKAIGALESEDLNDDTPALRELGLNYKDWFNNRTGEVYGEDKAGNPVTYGTYYRTLLELKDVLTKAEEEARLNVIRLKILHYRERDKYFTQLQLNLLNNLTTNLTENLKNKLAEINMNTPISQMTEWSPEMKKEMEAIGWDIASIIDPEAFTGSAMALYASHLRDEANPNRSTLEKWLDRGTAALGGILGVGDLLVTGKLGYRLYQLGKSMGSVSKFAGMLGAGFGAIGAYEAKDSIMKLSNPSSLTPLDIENISYGFMGLIGLKSFAKARNKQTIGKQSNPTIAEHNITINDKNGSHVIKVDEATAKEINNSYKFGRNNKTKSDAKTFNHEKVKKAVEEYNKNPENTKKIDLESASIQSSSKFGVTTEKPVKTEYVKNPNAPEYTPVGTKWYSPFGYIALGNNKWGYYLGGGWQRKAWENAVPEQSSKGLWLRAKEFWSPEPKPINETPSTTSKTKTSTSKTTEGNKPSLTYNDLVKLEYNALNVPNSKSSRLLKSGKYSGILADGSKYNFEYITKNGKKIAQVTNEFGAVLFSREVKNQAEAKESFTNFTKSINEKIKANPLFIRRFSKEYLQSIRELKKKGFFYKQGGTLDKTIENFLKNNNI